MGRRLGKTHDYPDGRKISKDDEGGLNMAISGDTTNRLVRIDFGTAVTWFSMQPELARKLAAVLLQKADLAEGKEQ